MHREAKKAIYDVGMEGFLRLHSDWDQKFRFLRKCNSVQTRIFSSHLQLSENITPQLLVRFWHMSNHRKAEKILCNFSIEVIVRFGS
jgi:hypothetical protein